ncbi:hypothetical protein L6164_009853 [Bauhinia variegata]|uniref:Uncharacterized protein n=1 Tax=Bauhinia variegata TaxID=167791 RepID=A0ACB9PL42_BAUVA|nr:hypothetical protein L6164_009853 [Bauhinia variegata]
MRQARPPFIATLVFSISLLSLAVIASSVQLNRRHLGRGRGPVKIPDSRTFIRKSNQGVAGSARHNRRSGGTGLAHHSQGQPGKKHGHHSNGTGNANQNQGQGKMGKAKGNHSGDTGNAGKNQNEWQVMKASGNHFGGIAIEQSLNQVQASGVFAREFLLAHNVARKKFNEPLYKWDNNLALYAQKQATKLSRNCKMIHSEGPYGENIFWGLNLQWKPLEAVTLWYKEYKNYDFNSHTCATGKKCGHFTQMMWRDSVRLGCAVHMCRLGTGMLIICEYDPPGNYENENPFDNNNDKQ